MSYKAILRILSIFVVSSLAQLALALELEQSHGSWTSGILFIENGVVATRAISGIERKTDVIAFFALDKKNGACSGGLPNIVVNFPQGADKAGFVNTGFFQARVDVGEIIKGLWVSSANEMGDQTIFVSLILSTEEQSQLIQNIKTGDTLRVKLSTLEKGDDDIYFNFSLSGSSAAINRATDLCSANQNDDKRYFEQKTSGLFIGKLHQGGVIFYIDASGKHGLIASLLDQSDGVKWGIEAEEAPPQPGDPKPYNTIPPSLYRSPTAAGIYEGANNTREILTREILYGRVSGNYAAQVAASFRIQADGVTPCQDTLGEVCYNDWYLPSKEELNLLYLQKDVVGGFEDRGYWSSTENDADRAWGHHFGRGSQNILKKNFTLWVRAIRSF